MNAFEYTALCSARSGHASCGWRECHCCGRSILSAPPGEGTATQAPQATPRDTAKKSRARMNKRRAAAGEQRLSPGEKAAQVADGGNAIVAGEVTAWRANLDRANKAPRCGARRRSDGAPCRKAAMRNGRCDLHGGRSTGPRTAEGLERSRRARWKHGHYSAEAKATRQEARARVRALREPIALAWRSVVVTRRFAATHHFGGSPRADIDVAHATPNATESKVGSSDTIKAPLARGLDGPGAQGSTAVGQSYEMRSSKEADRAS
jgi:hypothetical protein